MKPLISIAFSDFWQGFNAHDNHFTRLLSPHYDLLLSDNPDYLIYSCFGKEYRRSRAGTRIYFTGENKRPNFRECDYAFSFDYIDRPEHCRWPLYSWYGDPTKLVKGPVDAERILASKTQFCNFVYSNHRCKTRIKFFHKLSKYKRVDSGGRLLNNIGGPIEDKIAFLRNYKFTISFENSSYPGYTTEKIWQPMQAESLPIYWGNPLVHLDFNPKSFVNFYAYGNLDDLVDRVVEIDRDDSLYCQYVREPWYHGDVVSDFVKPEPVLAQFARIFGAERQVLKGWPWTMLPWRAAQRRAA